MALSLSSQRVVVLTGAGMSQESGIPTFRGSDGLWEGYHITDVATPEAFRRQPQVVHRFYNLRRRQLQQPTIQPNAAHLALAQWEASLPVGSFTLITQNVDDLHERAGGRDVIHMHGELLKARCMDSGEVFDWHEDLSTNTPHPRDPYRLGRLRPHIVWFGEHPLHMERIAMALADCQWFLAIGTSGSVYPAAGFVQWVPPGCRTIEINLEDTPVAAHFDECIRGRVTEEIPRVIAQYARSCGS